VNSPTEVNPLAHSPDDRAATPTACEWRIDFAGQADEIKRRWQIIIVLLLGWEG
jgi:hypothetical protein